ncbi:MAG: DUF6714 family protein [Phycisphaerales bacterium]
MAKPDLPESLAVERDAIIAEVYAAWKGVSRGGAPSWNEVDSQDDYATPQEQLAARATDNERSWEELIKVERISVANDWNFMFLDGVAKRYYIAPLLIKSLKARDYDVVHWIESLKKLQHDLHPRDQITLRQLHCLNRATKWLTNIARWKLEHSRN